MAEVLLIDPPFPERPWDVNWITQFPPKGILYVASAVRNAGLDVEVFDTKVMQFERPSLLGRSIEEIKHMVRLKVEKARPRVIGLTSSTLSYLTALKIAEAAKQASPESIVVIGGVHASFTPGDTLKRPFIDAVVRGEGEETIVEIANKVPLEKVKGISFRKEGKIIHNPDRPLLKPGEIPVPAYDLVDMKNYAYVVLMCTRGCPHKCAFCEIPALHGKVIRHRPFGKVEEELELAFSLNKNLEIRLEDEFLGFDMKRAEQILKLIKKKNVVPFRGVTRPDGVNDKLLKMLKAANCSNLYIGMESGSDQVLKINGRGTTVSKILEIAKLFGKNEMLFHAGFILGMPGENKETLEQTLKVAQKCCDSTFSTVKKNLDRLLHEMPFKLVVENSRAEFNLFAPNPGTPVMQNPEKFRYRIFHKNWDLYDCNTPVGEPFDIKAEELVKFKDFALNTMKKQMESYGLPVSWWDIGYKG